MCFVNTSLVKCFCYMPCSSNKWTGCSDTLAKDSSGGNIVTTFPFGDNLVSNHQLPILLSHSKKIIPMVGAPGNGLHFRQLQEYKYSGNTDKAPSMFQVFYYGPGVKRDLCLQGATNSWNPHSDT